MGKILDKINSPDDLKALDTSEILKLPEEIRGFLLESLSLNGGHLSSNLGVVELTIALHLAFDAPKDKIIWDVGHQSYTHKILTGRRDKFFTLRQYGGISGFPKEEESEYDVFNTGHSSTSLSVASGIATARDMKGENYHVVAVVGDGALTGGLCWEALNHIGHTKQNIIIVINDNEMSIGKNVGAFSKYLSKIRTNPRYYLSRDEIKQKIEKIPAVGKDIARVISKIKSDMKNLITPVLFEDLGLTYLGPLDGHNIMLLTDFFKRAKKMKGPIVIHVKTVKGKGYKYAQNKPDMFHGVPPFNVENGDFDKKLDYSNVFGNELIKIAQSEPRVCAITPAMKEGSGLTKFAAKFPERFFDVGIAEGHALTFAAGIAKGGGIPVVSVYSSFMQRAYDSILHDICLTGKHVVICVDRAGFVPQDGETHQGIFDISYLSHMPNISILSPANFNELRKMLWYAVKEHKGPIAIRYPRGGEIVTFSEGEFVFGKSEILRQGNDATIVAEGFMVGIALKAHEMLKGKGINVEVINAKTVKPVDIQTIISSSKKTKRLYTIEANVIKGGFGESVKSMVLDMDKEITVKTMGIEGEIPPAATVEQLLWLYGLDAKSVAEKIANDLRR
ncbi:MAG: 1-deoxy-D-xylulose-5-phosphate synthase [Clostridiaceae bacterium]|nr:1-deoxy-D-xylulose-5-phosphate synthase [Clostridiaceae bacterium]